MKREVSDLHLAALVADATIVGVVLTTRTGAFFIDAGTDKQRNPPPGKSRIRVSFAAAAASKSKSSMSLGQRQLGDGHLVLD